MPDGNVINVEAVRSGAERRTQERGRLRREALVASARQLLHTRDLDEILLTDMAQAAGIPKSSAYHLFDSAYDVYVAAVREIEAELQIHMSKLVATRTDRWQTVVRQFISHGVIFFNMGKDATQLLLGPKTPPAIKAADRETSDATIGLQLLSLLSHQFKFPEWRDQAEVFFHAVEIADLFFGLSVLRHGSITETYEREANLAVCGYLLNYLPHAMEPIG